MNRLDMCFRNQAGRIVTVRVLDPLDTLTATDVEAVMDTVIAKNVFLSSGGDLVAKVDARIVTLTQVIQEFSYA